MTRPKPINKVETVIGKQMHHRWTCLRLGCGYTNLTWRRLTSAGKTVKTFCMGCCKDTKIAVPEKY